MKTAFDYTGLLTRSVEHLHWTEFKQVTSEAAKSPRPAQLDALQLIMTVLSPRVCDHSSEWLTKQAIGTIMPDVGKKQLWPPLK